MSARVILLTGPSGSGKTSLLRRVGARRLKLDDFYRDGNEPGMPLLDGTVSGAEGLSEKEARSRIDWDDPASWDAARAVAVIEELCLTGRAEVPVYSIPDNATVSTTVLDLRGARAFVAEGVFAAEIIEECRGLGLLADALVLRRPRWQTWLFRLRRDMAEHRKPLPVLLTRGLRLARQEPERMARWISKGARPVSADACQAAIAEIIGSAQVPGNRTDGVV